MRRQAELLKPYAATYETTSSWRMPSYDIHGNTPSISVPVVTTKTQTTSFHIRQNADSIYIEESRQASFLLDTAGGTVPDKRTNPIWSCHWVDNGALRCSGSMNFPGPDVSWIGGNHSGPADDQRPESLSAKFIELRDDMKLPHLIAPGSLVRVGLYQPEVMNTKPEILNVVGGVELLVYNETSGSISAKYRLHWNGRGGPYSERTVYQDHSGQRDEIVVSYDSNGQRRLYQSVSQRLRYIDGFALVDRFRIHYDNGSQVFLIEGALRACGSLDDFPFPEPCRAAFLPKPEVIGNIVK